MSLLTVVRHAQASFLADNYDKLSPIGEEQSRLLARYWLEKGATFDQVYYGPAERHRRTGEIIADFYREAGQSWPEPVVLEELDEFPAEAVMRTFLPTLAREHVHLAEWMTELRSSSDFTVRQRAFDRVLRDITNRWLSGEVSDASVPTWQAFCARVEGALERILRDAPKSSRVAVFTSGGPKAVTVRTALRLSYENTLELTWSPRNASFSEFLFTPDRFSMSSFNSTPHLQDPALLTYR